MWQLVGIIFVAFTVLCPSEGSRTPSAEHGHKKKDMSFIKKFAEGTFKAITAEKSLSCIYDTTLAPRTAEVKYYDVVYRAVVRVYTPHPGSVAVIVSNGIRDTFSRLTREMHILTYGYAAATYMTTMGKLKADNVDERIEQYLSFVKRAARSVPHNGDKRLLYIQAASDGLVDFLTYLGIFTPSGVPYLAEDFSHFLYLCTDVPKKNTHDISEAAACASSYVSSSMAYASASASASSSGQGSSSASSSAAASSSSSGSASASGAASSSTTDNRGGKGKKGLLPKGLLPKGFVF